MALCGYSVVEDPNDGIIKRLTQLAEKMGMDMSQVSFPFDDFFVYIFFFRFQNQRNIQNSLSKSITTEEEAITFKLLMKKTSRLGLTFSKLSAGELTDL